MKLRLQRVTTLELNQLHLEVGWCVFHVNCRWITEQFKPTFRRVNSAPSTLCKPCTCGRDLRCHGLAAGDMAQVSLQPLILHRHSLVLKALAAAYMSVMTRPRPWSCRFSAWRWLVMSHRKVSSAVSFPLLSRNWHISSRSSKHLFSTFPRLNHLTSVWAFRTSHSSRKDLNWRWFRPLALMKLTSRVTVVITCSIFRALPHRDSWCMMQW